MCKQKAYKQKPTCQDNVIQTGQLITIIHRSWLAAAAVCRGEQRRRRGAGPCSALTNPSATALTFHSRLEALLFAAGSGDADAVQGLLRQGMPPDSANAEGVTPLILAASKGHNVSA